MRRAPAAALLFASVLITNTAYADDTTELAPASSPNDTKLATPPSGGDKLQFMFAATGAKSEWRTDAAAQGVFKIGYVVNENLSFYNLNRLGYATMNNRMLTFISLGAQLSFDLESVRPYVRLALAHQHEENVNTVKEDPIGAVLGFAKNINHRGGGEAGLGLELPVFQDGSLEAFASIEASTIVFLDKNGPNLYAAGTAGIGINYSL